MKIFIILFKIQFYSKRFSWEWIITGWENDLRGVSLDTEQIDVWDNIGNPSKVHPQQKCHQIRFAHSFSLSWTKLQNYLAVDKDFMCTHDFVILQFYPDWMDYGPCEKHIDDQMMMVTIGITFNAGPGTCFSVRTVFPNISPQFRMC